jgi:hypothetical protein
MTLALAASLLTSEVAAAQAGDDAGIRVVQVEGVKAEFGILGTDIFDCYHYNGTFRGCSSFEADPDPELFTVCDTSPDGRYVKGRLKIGETIYELGPIETNDPNYNVCLAASLDIPEGVIVGIHTGVENLGWTPYEYGFA